MKALDDATLLEAVARRDEAAFAELYDRLSRPVFSLVVRVLWSRAEAEEVLQETFWQIWERAQDYRAELGSVFCWVVTIARRKAIGCTALVSLTARAWKKWREHMGST